MKKTLVAIWAAIVCVTSAAAKQGSIRDHVSPLMSSDPHTSTRQQILAEGIVLPGCAGSLYLNNTLSLTCGFPSVSRLVPGVAPRNLGFAPLIVANEEADVIDPGTVRTNPNINSVFTSIAALRANTIVTTEVINVQSYYAGGTQGGGNFIYGPTDMTSADNGGTVIVDAKGHRYYRKMDSSNNDYNVMWFGAFGDGDTHPICNRSTSPYATLTAARAVFPFVASCTQEMDWAAIQGAIYSSLQYSAINPSWVQSAARVQIPFGRFRATETIDARAYYSTSDYPGNVVIPVQIVGAGRGHTFIEWWGTQPATTIRKAMVIVSGTATVRDITLICPRAWRTYHGAIPPGLESIRTPYYGIVQSGVIWTPDYTNIDVENVMVPFSSGVIRTANLSTMAVNGFEFEPSVPSTGFTASFNSVDFAQGTYLNTRFISKLDEVSDGLAGFTRAFVEGTNSAMYADQPPMTVSGASSNGGAIQLTVNSTSGWISGARVYVSSVAGATEANGGWFITVVDRTHIKLNQSTFVHAYTGGGSVQYILDGAYAAEIANPQAVADDFSGGLWASAMPSSNGVVRLVNAGSVTFSNGWTSGAGQTNSYVRVSDASNSGGAIKLTVRSTSSFSNNQPVQVSGIVGVPANGNQVVTVIDSTHLLLQSTIFSGTYVSGGTVSADFQASFFENVASAGSNIKMSHVYFAGIPIYRGNAAQCSLIIRDSSGENGTSDTDPQGQIKLLRPLSTNFGLLTCNVDIDGLSVNSSYQSLTFVDSTGSNSSATGYVGYLAATPRNLTWRVKNLTSLQTVNYGLTTQNYYEGIWDAKPNMLSNDAQFAQGSRSECCSGYTESDFVIPTTGANANRGYTTKAVDGKYAYITSGGAFRIAQGVQVTPGYTYIAEFKANLNFAGFISGIYGQLEGVVLFCTDNTVTSCIGPGSSLINNPYVVGGIFFGSYSPNYNYGMFAKSGNWALFRIPAITPPTGYPWLVIKINGTAALPLTSAAFADLAIYEGPVPGFYATYQGQRR